MLIGARLNNNFLYQVLCEFTDLNTLEPKYVVTIGGVVILITYIVIFIELRLILRVTKFLAEAERPFDVEMSFVGITENKSGQTGQHIKRVSEYSRIHDDGRRNRTGRCFAAVLWHRGTFQRIRCRRV